MIFFKIGHNVLRLGVVGELKAPTFSLAQM